MHTYGCLINMVIQILRSQVYEQRHKSCIAHIIYLQVLEYANMQLIYYGLDW